MTKGYSFTYRTYLYSTTIFTNGRSGKQEEFTQWSRSGETVSLIHLFVTASKSWLTLQKKTKKKGKTKTKTVKELIRMLGSTSTATTPPHIREKEGILAEHKIFLRSPGEGQRSLTFLHLGPTVVALGKELRFLFPGDCM